MNCAPNLEAKYIFEYNMSWFIASSLYQLNGYISKSLYRVDFIVLLLFPLLKINCSDYSTSVIFVLRLLISIDRPNIPHLNALMETYSKAQAIEQFLADNHFYHLITYFQWPFNFSFSTYILKSESHWHSLKLALLVLTHLVAIATRVPISFGAKETKTALFLNMKFCDKRF